MRQLGHETRDDGRVLPLHNAQRPEFDEDFNEVRLGGHDLVDVFVGLRRFAEIEVSFSIA
jgi:hypothetical protein